MPGAPVVRLETSFIGSPVFEGASRRKTADERV
jgi:hypothetical protein